ncbi:hypothetical protein PIB30_044293, partial [Stylosanthes scabra]|nr:hypothetical protein [Stylosanthes scabra]
MAAEKASMSFSLFFSSSSDLSPSTRLSLFQNVAITTTSGDGTFINGDDGSSTEEWQRWWSL